MSILPTTKEHLRIFAALTLWTSGSIRADTDGKTRQAKRDALDYLATVKTMPDAAFRAYRIFYVPEETLEKADGAQQFLDGLDALYPESYALTKMAAEAFHDTQNNEPGTVALALAITLDAKEIMIYVNTLIQGLPEFMLTAGVPPLSDYLEAQEIVCKAGTLKKAGEENRVVLKGTSTHGSPINWNTPQEK